MAPAVPPNAERERRTGACPRRRCSLRRVLPVRGRPADPDRRRRPRRGPARRFRPRRRSHRRRQRGGHHHVLHRSSPLLPLGPIARPAALGQGTPAWALHRPTAVAPSRGRPPSGVNLIQLSASGFVVPGRPQALGAGSRGALPQPSAPASSMPGSPPASGRSRSGSRGPPEAAVRPYLAADARS